MSNKNSKRVALEKIAKKEILSVKKESILNCGHNFCPLVLSRKSPLYSSLIIEDSNEFTQAIEDIRENYPRDHLNISGRIVSDFFEQEGVEDGYEVSKIDPLEDSGIHITDNPGFSYSS